MLHAMLDCFGVTRSKLDDMGYIYETLNNIIFKLGVNAVAPPILIPYHYGKVVEDGGISAYILLDGGHVTIHTYPYRACYFFDIVYDGFYDINLLKRYLNEKYGMAQCTVFDFERRSNTGNFKDITEYTGEDYGPHLLMNVKIQKGITIEKLYSFLDSFPYRVNMQPITRPQVIRNKVHDANFILGITLIAESHVSAHFNIETSELFVDIFSCCPFSVEILLNELSSDFDGEQKYTMVSRGTKYSLKQYTQEQEIMESQGWRKNIFTHKSR